MTGKLAIVSIFFCVLYSWWPEQPISVPQKTGSVPEQAWEAKRLQDYLGYESCRKCHQMQVEKLVTTAHFKSFETIHRSNKSKSYCRALGIRSIKRDARCIRCHYTPEESPRGMRAQSGISCESCHGPSKNWVQGHNDYGGLTVTKAQETREHREFRIKSSIKKGMRHPSNVYLLARSCYDCHLVDDAELVNSTDHPPISTDFNMVSWSQGSMRHNFLRNDNKSNTVSSPERLRVMFVVDLMAKIEAVLKAIPASDLNSRHYQFLQGQYQITFKQIQDVSSKVNNVSIRRVVDLLSELSPDANAESLLRASNEIKNLAFEFGKNETQHRLETIQDMLPSRDRYR